MKRRIYVSKRNLKFNVRLFENEHEEMRCYIGLLLLKLQLNYNIRQDA